MTTPLEILRRSREYLTDPEHWLKEGYAATEDGRYAEPIDSVAARFCATGIVCKACFVKVPSMLDRGGAGLQAIRYLNASVPGNGPNVCNDPETAVEVYNDEATHAEVLALFDRAIALAEKEAAKEREKQHAAASD